MEYWQTPQRKPSMADRFSAALGQGLQQGGDMMQKSQEKEAISNLLGPESSNLPQDFQKLMMQGKIEGDLESKKRAAALQSNQKILRDLENRRGLEEGSLDAYINDPKLADKVTKPEKTSNKPAPKSEAQKLLEKETAKGYIEAIREVPKLQNTLQNIGRLNELGEKLTGFEGYVKSAFNTESAAEYNTLGASLLDPVIKIFNPAGTLPQKKLEWIRDTFSPKASDLQSTQKGKIATIERMANQALERAQQKIKLFDDFNGDPPASEVLKFDNESEKIITDFIDKKQYISELEKETPEGKILMLDPEGKPLHVDPKAEGPDGQLLIEYYIEKGARLVNE